MRNGDKVILIILVICILSMMTYAVSQTIFGNLDVQGNVTVSGNVNGTNATFQQFCTGLTCGTATEFLTQTTTLAWASVTSKPFSTVDSNDYLNIVTDQLRFNESYLNNSVKNLDLLNVTVLNVSIALTNITRYNSSCIYQNSTGSLRLESVCTV